MTTTSRTFRIFVSSTFSDLTAERNALQMHVFPRLRELAQAHGCRFQAIDLRWGISEEAGLDQQTMRICLGEIARCQRVSPRPNFIVLLGDRYGWRPLPYAIPATEFEGLLPHLSETERALACWREGQPADTQGWYRLDKNAVPSEYVLRPRQPGSHFADYTAWESEVERPLGTALERAAQQAGLSAETLDKYTLSATGQEIVRGALEAADAADHVFIFLREIQGLPADASGRDYRDADPCAAQAQAQLKARLKRELPSNQHEYTALWQGNGPALDHLDALCADVYADLSRVMLAEVGQLETVDALDKERAAHLTFAAERARGFVGRADYLKMIADYLGGREPQPLAIWGASGSGKSALLAQALLAAIQAHPQAVIVARFAGATPESSNGRALLESLCCQIVRAYGGDEGAVPTAYHELAPFFRKSLGLATAEKPLILFLDALDQLSTRDRVDELAWLPIDLPGGVRLVLSTLPDKLLDQLANHLPASARLEVAAMLPAEGAQVLDAWLRKAQRGLTGVQRTDILTKFEQGGGLPLYLKLAFEEAQRWHSYDGLPALSDSQPGVSADIAGVVHDLFWRLEQENSHGRIMVAHALGYLAAARNGLSEDELLDVLWQDVDVRTAFFKRSPNSPHALTALPVVVWSRMYLDLEPYLAWRQADDTELLGFYHRQLREAVETRYCGLDAKSVLHRRLAAYFGNPERPFWLDTQQRQPDRRKVAELAYQQAYAGLATELNDTLTTFDFLHARLAAAGAEALITDYDLIVSPSPASPLATPEGPGAEGSEGLRLIHDGLRLAAHILDRDADQLPSQLFGRLQGFGRPEVRRLLETTRAFRNRPWLRPRTPCLTPPAGAELRTFSGHNAEVNAVALLPDERHALSASSDRTLKLWDLETGADLRTFRGHASAVKAVVVLADGQRALSGSQDRTLKLWDLKTGKVIRTFRGHIATVTSVALLPDGRRALSASEDHTLKLWDLETGKAIRTFMKHSGGLVGRLSGWLSAVNVLPDGRHALTASGDETLKLWDLETGQVIRIFTGRATGFSDVAALADGRRAISSSFSGTLTLWDLETGGAIRTFSGHMDVDTPAITALAVLPDGRRALSATFSGALKLWDLEAGDEIRTFSGHTGAVNAVAVLADGQRALSASRDNTLKLWDLEAGTEQPTIARHSAWIYDVAMLPGGQRAISVAHNGNLTLWDLETGSEVRTFAKDEHRVDAIAVLPDGRRALSASSAKTLVLWDLETGAMLRTFAGHRDALDVAVLADGQRAVSVSIGGARTLWDIETGQSIRTFTNLFSMMKTVTPLPDGQRAISGCYTGLIKVWDIETGHLIRTFIRHRGDVTRVAVLPDGQRALSASSDKSLKLWHIETGKVIRIFRGHNGCVDDVALLPDGQHAISVSWDHTLKLWNLETGQCRCTYVADGLLSACAVASPVDFVAGDSLGRMYFLRLEGDLPAPLLTDRQAKPVRLSFFARLLRFIKSESP